jgi:hypothetical protein
MSSRELAILPVAVGALVLHERAPRRRLGPRSHVHDGRCLECLPKPGYAVAVDGEAMNAPAGPYVAERLGLALSAFLPLWTRIEVAAKLTGVPAIALLQQARGGERLPCDGLDIRTVIEGDLVVSAGWARR